MNLICFSHLRWSFVFQRPQHLLSRLTKHFIVFYVEEPIFDAPVDRTAVTLSNEKVWIVVPHLKGGPDAENIDSRQVSLLNKFFAEFGIHKYMFWYYTPMALPYTRHFEPKAIIYDCMDELSAFKFAPPTMGALENELFAKADLVFTGGQSLYEAKKNRHPNIHPFPSSIDKAHFSVSRMDQPDPQDQHDIPYPRLGFFGVLDERFDIDLIQQVALLRPNWQLVLIGPVVKIDAATLPKTPNIHYLGSKTYAELPKYLSGWQVAMIPFALNESTRFISPTKTPEYLAAGKPVISTAIQDVVHPYGTNKLVHIVHNAEEFVAAAEKELSHRNRSTWLKEVDDFLSTNSWDLTVNKMLKYINQHLEAATGAVEKIDQTQKTKEVEHV